MGSSHQRLIFFLLPAKTRTFMNKTTVNLKRTPLRLSMIASLLLISTALLGGCSSHNSHQLVNKMSECPSCHTGEIVVYDDIIPPSSAVDVGVTVEVKTNHNAIYICTPLFTSDDGHTFVPLIQKRVKAENGSATVRLDPGVWVLSVDNGETADSILVESIPDIVTTTKKISL